jgi:hypothetical protein
MALNPDPKKKDEIVKIINVKVEKERLISEQGLSNTKTVNDSIDKMIDIAYNQGYHDARSNYNLDKPEPPITKELG